MILNGAARKNGSTAKLIQSFSKGACSVGHHIQEFYLDRMNIHSCKGCLKAGYAELECLGYGKFARECVLLMTADGSDYSQAVTWYRTYERNLGWKNRGEVLGKSKLEAAYQLGASL